MSLATFAAFEIPRPWSELLERTAPPSISLAPRCCRRDASLSRAHRSGAKGPEAQVSPHAS